MGLQMRGRHLRSVHVLDGLEAWAAPVCTDDPVVEKKKDERNDEGRYGKVRIERDSRLAC